MAKRMWMNWFRNACLFGGFFTDQKDGLAGNRLAGFLAGEQPFLGLFPAEVDPQQFQQSWRQQGLPVLAAFAATYPNHVTAAVNVSHLKLCYFRNPRASGVHGAQHRAVREILGRLQQELYLRRTQNHREFSLVPGQRDAIDADGKVKGVGVEKSESANGLYVGRKRHALVKAK